MSLLNMYPKWTQKSCISQIYAGLMVYIMKLMDMSWFVNEIDGKNEFVYNVQMVTGDEQNMTKYGMTIQNNYEMVKIS